MVSHHASSCPLKHSSPFSDSFGIRYIMVYHICSYVCILIFSNIIWHYMVIWCYMHIIHHHTTCSGQQTSTRIHWDLLTTPVASLRRSVGDLDEPFGRLDASPEEKEVAELLESLPPHHLKASFWRFWMILGHVEPMFHSIRPSNKKRPHESPKWNIMNNFDTHFACGI